MSYGQKQAERPAGYGIFVGFHHLEFYVANAKQAADWMCVRMGFERMGYKGLETGSRESCSHVIGQNNIRLVYTTALNPAPNTINDFVRIHGDAGRDVAFQVNDCTLVFNKAVEMGAVPVQQVQEENGVITASVQFPEQKDDTDNYGNCDCVHTFIQKPDGYDGFLPGFEKIKEEDVDPLLETLPRVGLGWIDHVVTNRGRGQYFDGDEAAKEALSHMINAAKWYEEKLGFHQFWSVDDSIIHTEYSALNSIVVSDYDRVIKMPINEPAPGEKRKKSQIQEYVEYHGGAGVQHIALRTLDIVSALRALRARGMRFLQVPDTYYDDLRVRLKASATKVAIADNDELLTELQRLNILVDFDEGTGGYLLQIFTEPVEDRPTLFYEIIQREGNDGFGAGNFKALFEAIELAQEERGNLTDMNGNANGGMEVEVNEA